MSKRSSYHQRDDHGTRIWIVQVLLWPLVLGQNWTTLESDDISTNFVSDGNITDIPLETSTVPQVLGVPLNLTYENLTDTSFIVSWTAPLGIPPFGYIVQWAPTQNLTHAENLTVNDTSCKVVGLVPDTSYTVKVAAESNAGQSDWSDAIIIRTEKEEPTVNAPNISIYNITATSFIVNWEFPVEPNKTITHYEISWQPLTQFRKKSSALINDTSYEVFGLDPHTNYSVSVRAVTEDGAGNWAEAVVAQTKIGFPGQPTNFNHSNVTDSSFIVHWGAPEDPNGPILHYEISWMPVAKLEDSSFDVVYNNTTYYIDGLNPYTNYSVKVSAVTEAGTGESSEIIVQTKSGTPGKPDNLTYSDVTNSSFTLHWNVPEVSNGFILGYEISWRTVTMFGNSSFDTSNDNFYTVQDLEPYTNYSVKVSAVTEAGAGEWSEDLVVQTETGLPGHPENLTYSNVTNGSFIVHWNVPEVTNGPVIGYQIFWKSFLEFGSSSFDFVRGTYYKIVGLDPYTNYSVIVAAVTEAGAGELSDELVVQTKIGIPGPPINLTPYENLVTNVSFVVMWESPIKNTGPILVYQVVWYPTKVPSNSTKAKTKDTKFHIKEVNPYTFYSVKVSAETRAGWGNWSRILELQTKAGLPDPPMNLSYSDITNTSVAMIWKQPRTLNGPLVRYTVTWKQSDKKPNASFVYPNQTSYVIHDLLPYTEYFIHVYAETTAGRGNASKLVVETDVGRPSSPRNPSVSDITHDGASLSWDVPKHPQGRIAGYGVHYFNRRLWTKTLSIRLSDLLPYKQYEVYVVGVNVDRKNNNVTGNATVFKFRTAAAVPNEASVEQPTLVRSKSLQVSWTTEGPFPGPTNYTLEVWWLSSVCESLSPHVIVRKPGTHSWIKPNSVFIEGLIPYSEYNFTIVLETEAGMSQNSESPTCWTMPDDPGPPLSISAVCDQSPTSAEISWMPPHYPNGNITEYLLYYSKENSPGSREVKIPVSFPCNEQSFLLENLHPEIPYKISLRAVVHKIDELGFSQMFVGDEAFLSKSCTLPAGVPPLGDVSLLAAESHGPHQISFNWSSHMFSQEMGQIRSYAVIVGKPNVLGNATQGSGRQILPAWSNFISGADDVYQATPHQWNPFILGAVGDPLACKLQVDDTMTCYLGREVNCSRDEQNFCNGPLQSSTKYGVKLRAFTRGGFSETPPFYAYTDDIIIPSSVSGWIIAVVVLLCLCLLSVPIIFLIRNPSSLKILWKHKTPERPQNVAQPQSEPQEMIPMEICQNRQIEATNFLEHVRYMASDSFLKFSLEFETLKKNSPVLECTAAEMEENRHKNRWTNILPFDHSRVKLLPIDDEPGSDFINANYIPGYSSIREYVASQGPLPHTVDDFWRMIWEQGISFIIILTQCIERGKKKCEQYWPVVGEWDQFGDIRVQTTSEYPYTTYTMRVFRIYLGSRQRQVKQMHFTYWPDFGCPESPKDLLDFVKTVRDHMPYAPMGPLLVHCSAGVGRTGTFIAVDRLMQHLNHCDSLSIYNTILEMRKHRTNMVQTEDQYIYIHQCICELIAEKMSNEKSAEEKEPIYSNVADVVA